MPSIQKKTVKGIDYWYLIESKRVNGKVKTEVLEYFGNTKKLMQRFTDILHHNENMILKSYFHGDTYALLKIARKLNMEQILQDVLPHQTRDGVNRSTSLLLIALQRVCKPASKMAFSRWYASTTLPDALGISSDLLTSNHFWEQMEGITEAQIQEAEDRIAQKIWELYDLKLDKIALDYTNYFSYIDSANTRCELAHRGHNKQKRNDLRQYSMAVITSKDMGIPLYSHIYEGNRNDQTEFKEYITLLKKRIPDYDKKELTIVFDGGSVTKRNLTTIDNYYICRFHLSSCKELYDVDIEAYDVEKVEGKEIRYKKMRKEIGGKLIITNRDDWSAEEIIKTYHDQDCIEKVFRNSKNSEHFSIRPQYHYTDQKIQVHIFCCLLGLVLVGILNKELKNRDIKISNLELVERLGEIRQCWLKETGSNKVTKIVEDLDETNRKIWGKYKKCEKL